MQVKGLLVRPFKRPEPIEMENSLENLQKAVEGLIDVFQLEDDGVDIYLNDEGKLLNLPINRILLRHNRILEILVGNLLILGVDEETGDSLSLDEEQQKKYQAIFDHEIIDMDTISKE